MNRILVVDDEEGIRSFIYEVLEGEGYQVSLAEDGQEAVEILKRQSFHLMITDLKMPRLDGMALLKIAQTEQPEMEVIVLTAHGTVNSAVTAMKLGAYDYLQKPLSGPDELRLVASRALERRKLLDSRRQHIAQTGEIKLVAHDPVMLKVIEQLDKVSPTNSTVLLYGESGTGKEVAARRLHRKSPRRDNPFVAVNCAALSAQLLESELFGHEKGAFTGAVSRQRGRFELADSGTLFLDEISELKPELQAKLLRVLQERSFERVGGTRTIDVDIRLIAATNRDLSEQMQAGQFRQDLYHRIAVFPIQLPPLRDRPGDILPLAEYLLKEINLQLGRKKALEQRAQKALLSYTWPGNVRELSNVLERAAIMASGSQITSEDLVLVPAGQQTVPEFEGSLKELEHQAIQKALKATKGHRKKAAERLGIGLRTLYEKIKEYGLG